MLLDKSTCKKAEKGKLLTMPSIKLQELIPLQYLTHPPTDFEQS